MEVLDLRRKHALHSSWQFSVALRGWDDRKLLPPFAFAEDAWAQFDSFAKPSALPAGTTIYLFRADLVPTWESLPGGGEWSSRGDGEMEASAIIDTAWEALVMGVVGEMMGDPSDICGCELGVKRGCTFKLALWTRRASMEAVQRAIATQMDALLPIQWGAEWSYSSFATKRKDAVARGGVKSGRSKSSSKQQHGHVLGSSVPGATSAVNAGPITPCPPLYTHQRSTGIL